MESNLTTSCTTMVEVPWTTVTKTSTAIETITICKNRTSTPTILSSTTFSITVDGEAMAMPFYTQDLSAKTMPLLGLNSTARNGIVTDTTGIVTSLPNQTMRFLVQ
ncbi:hypothetical protein X797_010950 [Metarhizium robertsii]|uniref:Uncharacterized protein n=1 Tax=Metarhizium robertsii TaxID=568076 RepID=A0A0A1UNJ7_9HYPO|nr:hypothetical protein X797_010950 [Metarhizium robertsii]